MTDMRKLCEESRREEMEQDQQALLQLPPRERFSRENLWAMLREGLCDYLEYRNANGDVSRAVWVPDEYHAKLLEPLGDGEWDWYDIASSADDLHAVEVTACMWAPEPPEWPVHPSRIIRAISRLRSEGRSVVGVCVPAAHVDAYPMFISGVRVERAGTLSDRVVVYLRQDGFDIPVRLEPDDA